MTFDIALVLVILVVTVAVFIWDRFRMDMVALGVVLALMLSGLVTPQEAVSGFGNTVVVMIAALFVVGEGIFRTGVAGEMGNWLVKVGGTSELRLLLVLLPMVALLSTSISSTGTVALLLPVVMNMARKANLHPARLLMPMAVVTLVAGTTTLIGTPPNIVVSGALREVGREGFSFFDFTPVGVVVLLVTFVFVMTAGRWLLPRFTPVQRESEKQSLRDFAARYRIDGQLRKILVPHGSSVVGQTITELKLRERFDVTLFAINRQGRMLSSFIPALLNTKIENGDVLWVYGHEEALEAMCAEEPLVPTRHSALEVLRVQRTFGYVEVMIPPGSSIVGATLIEAAFRRRYGLNLVGIIRDGEPLPARYTQTRLQAGDTLLLTGSWSHIRALGNERDVIVLHTPVEMQEIAPNRTKAPLALLVLLAMIVVMGAGWLPNVATALIAALAMIAFGCVSIKEAYGSLHAASLVVIAGLLPLSLAMEKTGTVSFVVNSIVEQWPAMTPLALMALLFVMTGVLSQFISNTASTILIAPVGISMSQTLGVAPEPVMMAIAIAASSAFATPIATPVNMLIVGPGEYRFRDFVRIGIPLQLLAMAASLLVIPWVFPF